MSILSPATSAGSEARENIKVYSGQEEGKGKNMNSSQGGKQTGKWHGSYVFSKAHLVVRLIEVYMEAGSCLIYLWIEDIGLWRVKNLSDVFRAVLFNSG